MADRLITHLRRALFVATAALLVLSPVPSVVFADTAGDPAATANSTTCTPVAPTAGIQKPTGSDAATYTYNSCTGLWENQYYTWSPDTKITLPKTPLVYTCDQTTWTWLTYVWTYNAATASYYQAPVHASALPDGSVVDPTSLNPCAPLPQMVSSNSPSAPTADGSTSGTTNTIGDIQNQIVAGATSGGAVVDGNTLAGSATSGSASATATVINAVQSSTSLSGGPVATFTATINGDVQGDLIVDPTKLQPATSSSTLNGNLDVNNQTTGQITNNIQLTAATGDAAVTDNTTAGNATTGNATAIANVVNVLNSLVNAGQSFIGVININGNMQGNILLPKALFDELITSNAPSTTMTLSNVQTGTLGIANTNNLSTTNTVTSTATSGSATVSGNTQAGSATTGSASTQVRVFNLTGSQVISANCLLVFVNVSGKWIGVIFNAPVGATAAALGSGVTANTVNNTAVTNTTNDSITNTIGVSAASGNALVAHNTDAGNATSGNASTAVNLLNMNNSEFNVSGWFGILFINIFGNWYGSLGIYDPAVHATSHSGTGRHTNQAATPHMFGFIPTTDVGHTPASAEPSISDAAAKFAQKAGDALTQLEKAQTPKIKPSNGVTTEAIGGIVVALGFVLFAAERLIVARQARVS